ncbi:MAG TPA: TRAP transporter large permease subunit [Burkholderiales bacterium]|nr:TRAP transporter large permease subunit [Burkholderiales bacterium]
MSGWMAPLMFGGLVLFLLAGYPVAFALAAVGLAFGLYAVQAGYFDFALLQAMPERVFGILSNELLLAIPFFTFMGAVLQRTGLAEDLLEGIGQLFGPVRGGLAFAVIIVGAIFGAITGTVAASVIAMGVIALPIMMRYGYSTRVATGVVAASGTITQIIPPSLVLIVLADQLGRSVGDMYAGAIGASLMQVLLFCAFIALLTFIRPQAVPALPPEARTLKGRALALKIVAGVVPSLGLMFLVLGTILLGLATPTEGGAMGAVGALLVAAAHRRLNWPMVWQAGEATMRLTAMVIFILIGSTVFALVFRGLDGDLWVERLLTGLPGGVVGFLVAVNALVFVPAFFLDFFEIAFIIIPLLAPVAAKLGIDLVWFGVLLGANMQTSFMHPPFGFALFYLRGIAPPEIKTSDIYWGALPWVGLQLILVAILIAWPELVTGMLDHVEIITPGDAVIDIDAPVYDWGGFDGYPAGP